MSSFSLGIQQIERWTKESLREKPFSAVKGKIWTETPSSIPLEKIFTKLCWVTKTRETYGVVYEELTDIAHLLIEQQLVANGPVRILVQGIFPIGIKQTCHYFSGYLRTVYLQG